MSARGARGKGRTLISGLHTAGIGATHRIFQGEASLQEIERHGGALRGSGVERLIALAGGKCVDAGTAMAHRIGVPTVVAPTLASNDAPCSALSVLYTPDGVYADVAFYPLIALLVIVDTGIIAATPARLLAAGMGDAMATWHKARACRANLASLDAAGAGQTIAACAIGEACATGARGPARGRTPGRRLLRGCRPADPPRAGVACGRRCALAPPARSLAERLPEPRIDAPHRQQRHRHRHRHRSAQREPAPDIARRDEAAGNTSPPAAAPTAHRQPWNLLSMLTRARRAQQ